MLDTASRFFPVDGWSVEKPAKEGPSGHRFLAWVIRHLGWPYEGGGSPVELTGVFCSAFSYSYTEKFPCRNGLVEIVPCRSLMVWTIRISYPIGISYLIDSRCLSSMSLLKLAPVCLHAMFVLGGTSRGALVCHRLVPIVISPMSPYCVWY